MLPAKQKIAFVSRLTPTSISASSFILGGLVASLVFVCSDELTAALLRSSSLRENFSGGSPEQTTGRGLSTTNDGRGSIQSSSTAVAAVIGSGPQPVVPIDSSGGSDQKTAETEAPLPAPGLPPEAQNEARTSTETVPEAQTPAAQKIPTLVDMEEINKQTRTALVNILCTTAHGGSFQPITATGVLIDERGIVLTNAHVAQYLLLANYTDAGQIDCFIRTGSPAQARYRAEILYISPRWIEKNRHNLTEDRPLGTGEFDYALLQILKTTDPGGVLPASFPAIALETDNDASIAGHETVLIAGYPAGFLGGISVQKDLYISSTISKISELFTFENGSIDLFSLGGTVLAQKGSSGGAVVRQKTGKLSGIVATSLEAPTTDLRDLRAISLGHIERSMAEEIGISLSTFLLGDTDSFRSTFSKEEAPRLAKLLIDSIKESGGDDAKKNP